jgi:hypothetical protein
MSPTWKNKAQIPSSETVDEKLASLQASVDELSTQFASIARSIATSSPRQPRGGALLKYLGVSPDRFLERYYEDAPENDFYEALYGGSESLRGRPAYIGLKSGLCRQIHFSTDEYRYWMNAMGRRPRMHRKDWEWFYIAQALFERDMLQQGKKGLVFAVGQEPLPSLFATYGCDILTTDQAPEKAVESGWAHSNMYSSQVETLFDSRICTREQFDVSVRYTNADMNDIPTEFANRFDFCWSSCAFEHLGSLEHGMAFVERSIDTLVPGGVAVHTTEYNLSSDDHTIESPGLSIYRRQDITALTDRLERAGHHVETFDWTVGSGFAETLVDLPPYKQSPHLKVKIQQYDCTSIGLIVRKGGE